MGRLAKRWYNGESPVNSQGMNKQIFVTHSTTHGTTGLLPGLPAATNWPCNIPTAMLVLGYVTSPPRYRGFHLSTFWAWLRYLPAISTRGASLRLRGVWDEIDAHQKMVLSDDFGMGIAATFLAQQFAFEDFSDTAYLLADLLPGFISVVNRPKRGPPKLPDFIATDSYGNLHVLECKGAQTSQKSLRKAMLDGIPQKGNLSNGTLFKSSMVSGVFVPQFKSKEPALLTFIDPEPDNLDSLVSEIPRTKLISAIRRQSLAKSLGLAGLWRSATVLSTREHTNIDTRLVRRLRNGELLLVGYEEQTNFWTKTIEYRSFEAEAANDELIGYETTLKISLPDSLVVLLEDALSANGRLNESVVSDWLTTQIESRRRNTLAPSLTNRGTRQPDSDGPELISSWHFDYSPQSNAATIVLPSGISFELTRLRI